MADERYRIFDELLQSNQMDLFMRNIGDSFSDFLGEGLLKD